MQRWQRVNEAPGQLQLQHGLAEAHEAGGLVAGNGEPMLTQLQKVPQPCGRVHRRLSRRGYSRLRTPQNQITSLPHIHPIYPQMQSILFIMQTPGITAFLRIYSVLCGEAS